MLALVTLLGQGCSMTELVANSMVPALKEMQAGLQEEESLRQAREAAPALLTQLDGIIALSPENPELLLLGAEMNASFGFGLIEPEDPDWARALYRKARRYALRALAEENEDLHRSVVQADEDAVRKALQDVDRKSSAIPALFWTAFGWGSAINVTRDNVDVVSDLPVVIAIMERLVTVAPDFYNAGPHLFFAVYYSSRGRAIGGDPVQAAKHYKEVFRRTRDRMLMAHVLYAQFYCVAIGSAEPVRARKEFQDHLFEIL